MVPAKTGFGAWYERVVAFKIEDLFSRNREPGPPRTVLVNENIPGDFLDHKGKVKAQHVYPTNQVITSKYTIITFLPRNMLEQFRRIANMFFLGISILQFFPKFSTIAPGVVILPLVIVLGVTALKDGYEDVKRHQSDWRVNHSTIRVLSGGYWSSPNITKAKSKTFVTGLIPIPRKSGKVRDPIGGHDAGMLRAENQEAPHLVSSPNNPNIDFNDTGGEGDDHNGKFLGHDRNAKTSPHWNNTLWEDVRVGDFVKIMNNEPFPADILICATSEEENVAFVETKNLDGETNLKSRHAVQALTHLRTAADCANKRNTFRVDCDCPDTNMYRLNGAVLVNEEKFPVDLQMSLLRGTVLRNTDWVIGVVLYTGVDTKIVMNSGGTPSKRSKVERQMNPQVLVNLTILATMAIVCAIADSALERQLYPLGAPWLYGDNRSDDKPSKNGLVTWAFALLTFQAIVPISLYLSIEFVRTCQAAFIYFDKGIWHDKTDQATLARSWNLSDDLGQIEYIFSDKTGTLTQNSMIFRRCSIGGKIYSGDSASPENTNSEVKAQIETNKKDLKSSDIRPSSALSSTATGSGGKSANNEATVPKPLEEDGVNLSKKVMIHFSDTTLKEDLEDAISADPSSENAGHARLLNGFFTVLALCHTVLTSVDPKTGEIEYKAQSPDEAALVQAAADVGFIFRGRDREVLRLLTPFSEKAEEYELLNILEFTSARKRMSVVLRKMDGEDERLFLLTKGADSVIFERLKPGGDELKATTEMHLDEFASEGFRTLTLAYKIIQEEEYESWIERYHEATVAMDDREAKIEAISDELEHDLRLLGATAIEDRLQDGVPETIADLKRAGIKIWVATGDKLETAIAIGHSTNLIERESNIIIIRGGSARRPIYQQIVHAIEKFFPETEIVDDHGTPDAQRVSTSSRDSERPYPLQRINTGNSSIVGQNNGDRPGGFVLVMDGTALGDALRDEQNKYILLRLAMLCDGVICCRVSPLQKALIVKLVKDGLGAICLAIGDGANDVSMIQAADVGVGISGEEGLQAVNSSDYAIAQFRFLKRLLLVHGHWSYARNGNLILNFFYKNIIPVGVQWWFQIYNGWSATYVFNYPYILFWNSFWTIAPVIGIGLFDRVVDSHVLMDLPELYRYGREGHWFGIKLFLVYMIDGVYQSLIVFFLILYAYAAPTSRKDGYDVYIYEFSTTMAISSVMIANLFTGLNTSAWTGWVFFAVFLGIVIVWVFTAVYSALSPGAIVTPVFGNDHYLFTSVYFWLCIPLTGCLALAPRYLAKAYKFGFAPDDIHIVRWINRKEPHRNLAVDARLASGLSALKRPLSLSSRRTSRTGSMVSVDPRQRPSVDVRSASRTDMSTGIVSVDRGFDFATEENGVVTKNMLNNLAERRSSRSLALPPESEKGKESLTPSRMLSLRRGLLKRKPPSSNEGK